MGSAQRVQAAAGFGIVFGFVNGGVGGAVDDPGERPLLRKFA